MNILIIFLFSFGINLSFGKSLFLEKCREARFKNEKSVTNKQIAWLKTLLRTNDCNLISKKIETVKSYTELIPLLAPNRVNINNRLFKPSEMTASHLIYEMYQNEWDQASRAFHDLSLFREFKNITHLFFETHFDKRSSICETIKQLPGLNSIAIESWDLKESEIQCIINNDINIYILGNFYPSSNSDKFRQNIAGINNFLGPIEDLRFYRRLSYLGLEDYDGSSDLKILSGMRNLTNLHLNVINLTRVEDIKSITSLVNLSLNCYERHHDVSNLKLSDVKCKTNQLTDLSFLKNLIWLKGLDLSWNEITDITPLSDLTKLEHINLRMNKISNLSALKRLDNVKYLDISGNEVETIDDLLGLKKLKFLNLSSNNIHSVNALSTLIGLKYLSLGNNSFNDVHHLYSLSNLKVLNLDAEGAFKFNRYPEVTALTILNSVGEGEEKTWAERILYEDLYKYYSKDIETTPNPTYSDIDFSKLKSLEVLTMTKHELTKTPDLSKLRSLKYLDLSFNSFKNSKEDLIFPISLRYLNLENSLSENK